MKIKKISEVLGLKVYTDAGDFFGEIEHATLADNKIDGWKVRLGNGVVPMFGGVKGVVIPQQFVRSISDVFVINKGALPGPGESGLRDSDDL